MFFFSPSLSLYSPFSSPLIEKKVPCRTMKLEEVHAGTEHPLRRSARTCRLTGLGDVGAVGSGMPPSHHVVIGQMAGNSKKEKQGKGHENQERETPAPFLPGSGGISTLPANDLVGQRAPDRR